VIHLKKIDITAALHRGALEGSHIAAVVAELSGPMPQVKYGVGVNDSYRFSKENIGNDAMDFVSTSMPH